MIYTLTTNPAVDVNITSDDLRSDKINRTRDAVYSPNGKGLNVSFTLAHYGVDSQILGFFGGFTGNYIVEGASKICPVKPVWIDGITRLNVFLKVGDKEYDQVNAGAPVSREAQLQMLELIDNLDDLDCLIISGSLPPHIDPGYYDELIDIVQAKGAEFVLDISHLCLAHLIERKPLLIKPNDDELADIFGVNVSSEQDFVAALHMLHERGAQNILLHLVLLVHIFMTGSRCTMQQLLRFPYFRQHVRVMQLLQVSCPFGRTGVVRLRTLYLAPWQRVLMLP